MRAVSSVASLTLHGGIGGAVLLGSAPTGRSTPTRHPPISIVFPTPVSTTMSGIQVPSGPPTISTDLGTIHVPDVRFENGAPAPAPFTGFSAAASPVQGSGPAGGGVLIGCQDETKLLTTTFSR